MLQTALPALKMHFIKYVADEEKFKMTAVRLAHCDINNAIRGPLVV